MTAREKLTRMWFTRWASAFGVFAFFAERTFAHGSFSLDEERLNVGLVTLSFAMIAAFVYLVAHNRRDPGREA